MTLVRYNPLTNFVPSTFGDLIESALRDTNNTGFVPQTDIIKSDKFIELQIIAPGMNKSDFTIDLNENVLTISGERKDTINEEMSYIKKESKYGHFERAFTLSEDINTKDIAAKYEDGILKIKLPIVEKKINKATIQVK